MEKEIRDHIWGYMAARKDVKWSKAPVLLKAKCDLEAIGTQTRYEAMRGHCHVIDIYEGDVYDWKQAPVFGYFDGIRDCYFHTEADPYMNGLNIRVRFNKYSSVPLDRTRWQLYLSSRGQKW